MNSFFFFNDTATTEIYTLSLHDALPIFGEGGPDGRRVLGEGDLDQPGVLELQQPHEGADLDGLLHQRGEQEADRKSTRLNSSHANISYAVFCLKKKKKSKTQTKLTSTST